MSEIKFQDYLFLGNNALPSGFPNIKFIDYFEYLLNTGFSDLKKMLTDGLRVSNLPNRCDEQIVEGILATTPKSLERKQADKNYYYCNAMCLLNTIQAIFTSDVYKQLSDPAAPAIFEKNYSHILTYLLHDAHDLCNRYQNVIENANTYSTQSRYVHFMPIHQTLRQSLYGQWSLHSFVDMEISSAIAIIRQLIEIRIRRAFGVICYIDNADNLLPLDLSRIFETLIANQEKISFPVKIKNIERIYKWSNMYVHAALCDFSWIPYFIERYLRPLSFGCHIGQSWSINNGIKTNRDTIEKIHQELLLGKESLSIFSCPLECYLQDNSTTL